MIFTQSSRLRGRAPADAAPSSQLAFDAFVTDDQHMSSAARQYLGLVYHDPKAFLSLPSDAVEDALTRLTFVYYEAVALGLFSNLSCKASFHDYRSSMGDVALLHRSPNLLHRMTYYGFWRARRVSSSFAEDGTWAEVLRFAPWWSLGEGGTFGCWFELSRGSGIAINVGRSLRVNNRSELVKALDINISNTFARPIRGGLHHWMRFRQNASRSALWPPLEYSGVALDDEQGLRRRYFDNNPWRLEARVDLCTHAARLRYDSIQIADEVCSMDHEREACGVELVSCHAACLALRTRRHRRACPGGTPLRTGWNLTTVCHCNSSAHQMLNCAGHGDHIFPSPRVRSLRLPECSCSWCEGNHSHVNSNTQA